MNIKIWKLWLFSSMCLLLVCVINIISEKYLLGSIYALLVVTQIFLSRTYYKQDADYNKSEIADIDIELKKYNGKNKKLK